MCNITRLKSDQIFLNFEEIATDYCVYSTCHYMSVRGFHDSYC